MSTTNSKSKIPSIANFIRIKFEAIGSNTAGFTNIPKYFILLF